MTTALTQAAEGPASPKPGGVTTASRASGAGRQPLWLYAVVIIGALGVLSLAYSALFSPATMLTSGQQISDSASGTSSRPGTNDNNSRGCSRIFCACARWHAS